MDRPAMLPIELRIDRAQRLLRMIEQDAPLLAARVAPLSRERQQSAKSYARQLAVLTRETGPWLIRSIHWSSRRR